jgi:hypothetical protein
MIASVVDWDALLTVVWASLAAGIGVTAVYGFAILGGTRAFESARNGYIAGAVLFGALGLMAIAAVVAALVFGIVVLSE